MHVPQSILDQTTELLVPFKTYHISGAFVSPPITDTAISQYPFHFIATEDTLIEEIQEAGQPSLPLHFQLHSFSTLAVIADTDQLISKLTLIPCNIFSGSQEISSIVNIFFKTFLDVMGIVLHALPVKTITSEGTTSIARDYVIADQE